MIKSVISVIHAYHEHLHDLWHYISRLPWFNGLKQKIEENFSQLGHLLHNKLCFSNDETGLFPCVLGFIVTFTLPLPWVTSRVVVK